MNAAPEGVGLLALGAILAGVGVGLTSTDFALATVVAAGGTVLAVAGAAVLLFPAVRYRRSPSPPLVGAPIVGLRDALRSGPLGRQRVIATVVSLSSSAPGRAPVGMSPDEERRLLALDPAAFRAWLDAQLERLERDT